MVCPSFLALQLFHLLLHFILPFSFSFLFLPLKRTCDVCPSVRTKTPHETTPVHTFSTLVLIISLSLLPCSFFFFPSSFLFSPLCSFFSFFLVELGKISASSIWKVTLYDTRVTLYFGHVPLFFLLVFSLLLSFIFCFFSTLLLMLMVTLQIDSIKM